jgi:hypothetical protein
VKLLLRDAAQWRPLALGRALVFESGDEAGGVLLNSAV